MRGSGGIVACVGVSHAVSAFEGTFSMSRPDPPDAPDPSTAGSPAAPDPATLADACRTASSRPGAFGCTFLLLAWGRSPACVLWAAEEAALPSFAPKFFMSRELASQHPDLHPRGRPAEASRHDSNGLGRLRDDGRTPGAGRRGDRRSLRQVPVKDHHGRSRSASGSAHWPPPPRAISSCPRTSRPGRLRPIISRMT